MEVEETKELKLGQSSAENTFRKTIDLSQNKVHNADIDGDASETNEANSPILHGSNSPAVKNVG